MSSPEDVQTLNEWVTHDLGEVEGLGVAMAASLQVLADGEEALAREMLFEAADLFADADL